MGFHSNEMMSPILIRDRYPLILGLMCFPLRYETVQLCVPTPYPKKHPLCIPLTMTDYH